MISPTLSPTLGVGAKDRSTTPKGIFSSEATRRPISSPQRVTRNAVCLISSAKSCSPRFWLPSRSILRSRALAITPGPLTPTLITTSLWSRPWMAPAMNGLSPGWLVKTTNLAAPKPPLFALRSARSLITLPIMTTASMLMPLRVVPTLTDEQIFWVRVSASGMDLISSRSPEVKPLATSAE